MTLPVTHYIQKATIVRQRTLPAPARILVRRGQIVGTLDPVVEELFVSRHLLLDAARGLGVSAERADQLFAAKIGKNVTIRDLLAGPVGLTRRVIRAPASGKVVLAENGQILLELNEQPFQLKSGLPGEVIDLISESGVVIQAHGALIQGAWGNGQINHGEIFPLLDQPDFQLTPDVLGIHLAGKILVSGYCDHAELFELAAQNNIRGIILSSMRPALAAFALNTSIPVMLLEGFGRHALNQSAFDTLRSCEGLSGALNAEWRRSQFHNRPELVAAGPDGDTGKQLKSFDFPAPGNCIRLVGTSVLGRSARLMDLTGDVTLPNKLTAAAAVIQFPDGELVTMPLGNLEILD